MTSPVEAIAHAVRRERMRIGVSLSELARQAGLSKATLSQLEAGSGNPGVETVWALSVALGVPFSHLVAPPTPTVRIVRAGEGFTTRAEDADYTATLLAACAPRTRADIYRITARPGRARLSEPHLPGTLEHVIVTDGRAEAGPPDGPIALGPGDYVSYPGDLPHVFRALTPDTRAIFVLEQS
ncbi:XRE family transcriptional regulator [Actinoallomurus bryophytorum]|uniref:XRE family transcriptional regulator n=1 Tax=Actinoallomurus bryophytorum TaxID=1490222 RepID=A0A543CNR6_9ACTN|nr:XRE family transcriptional regulator [Actinoallomurus bryophytorum]TQL98744.1 XRE family transcriptional regulator [Actinoallomurus bryophytorum]